jgi:hypothetical protein
MKWKTWDAVDWALITGVVLFMVLLIADNAVDQRIRLMKAEAEVSCSK